MAMLRTSYVAHGDKHLDKILETFAVIGRSWDHHVVPFQQDA
jgi:hypothetical protein